MNNWGPVPLLMRNIASTASPRSWVEATDRPGALWSAAAATAIGSLWPPGYPARSVPTPKPFSFDGEGLAGWLAARMPRGPAPPGDDLLRECHSWLAARNIERLVHLFAPFADCAPAAFAQVSGQGLVWVAAACHLDRWGPHSFLRARIDLAQRKWPVVVGDCVAFHIAIEDLVASLKGRLGLKPVAIERRPGGLRSATTLSVLPALAVSRKPAHAVWRRAISTLIASSPLTRLVYADLNEAAPDPPKDFFAALFTCDAPAAGRTSWRDIWRSQLSRSLLGAILSPPPSTERLRAAQWDLERAAAARKEAENLIGAILGIQSRRLRTEDSAKRALAVEQQALTTEYDCRLPALASALAAESGFHRRFIDMCVRHVGAERADEMVARWKALLQAPRPRGVKKPEARVALFFGGHDAVCFARFDQLLFGPGGWPAASARVGVGSGRVVPGQLERLREGLMRLHPADASDATVRDQLVTLPVDDREGSYPPSMIWREWVNLAYRRLPATAAATEVVPV